MPVKQTIISFIQEKTHSSDINLEDGIFNTIKSFDFMVLMLNLENQFSINLPFDQVDVLNINKISHFISWVEQHHAH